MRGQQCSVVSDGLQLPHPPSRFDFVISIAVIHHFSTSQRRIAAIREILNALKPPIEQHSLMRKDATALFFVWALEQKTSRRGWDIGHDQDVMVPWVMKSNVEDVRANQKHARDAPRLSSEAPRSRDGNRRETGREEVARTLQRYYHLYRAGELEKDIVAAGGVVTASGYENDNWWVIAKKTQEER